MESRANEHEHEQEKTSAGEARIRALLAAYGDGADGGAPTETQWRRLLERTADAPTLVFNLFKLRKRAVYTDGRGDDVPGAEAFARYSAVSMPTLSKVGGHFLTVSSFQGGLVGEDEDWDLVAVGSYPDREAVLALFEDPAYREAWVHRRAACLRQRVWIAG